MSNPTLHERMSKFAERLEEIEQWMHTCQRYMRGGDVAELQERNESQGTTIKRYMDEVATLQAEVSSLNSKHAEDYSRAARQAGKISDLEKEINEWHTAHSDLQALHDVLSTNCTALRMGEWRKQISELELSVNSLKYQNKQGRKIRKGLEQDNKDLEEKIEEYRCAYRELDQDFQSAVREQVDSNAKREVLIHKLKELLP